MGEHKNTILAIVLSLLVVVGWQYFIGYPQMQRQQEQAQLKQQEADASPARRGAARRGAAERTPQASAPPVPKRGALGRSRRPLARGAVIARRRASPSTTPRLRGSIDLKGGRIDDLTLQQYRETVDPNSPPIVLFSPSGAPDAYYAEFGWVPAAGTTRRCRAPIRCGSRTAPARSASTIR